MADAIERLQARSENASSFASHFILELPSFLPRQARDKHGESTQKRERRFLIHSGRHLVALEEDQAARRPLYQVRHGAAAADPRGDSVRACRPSSSSSSSSSSTSTSKVSLCMFPFLELFALMFAFNFWNISDHYVSFSLSLFLLHAGGWSLRSGARPSSR